MADTIMIKVGAVAVQAQLNSTSTARALVEILPVKAKVNTWGD